MNSVSKVSPPGPVGLVSGMSGCLGEWILGKSASKTKSAVSKSYYLSKIYFDKLLLSSSGDEYMPDSLYMWKLFEISYHKRYSKNSGLSSNYFPKQWIMQWPTPGVFQML